MELTRRKSWPGYYKVIRKPQRSDNILAQVSRCQRSTSSHLFASGNSAPHGTPSVSTFSKDAQSVFSNAMELSSEGSQIHEDAQTLKVCSLQVVVYALWEAEPTVSPTSISLCPIPPHHTLLPSI